MRAPVCDRTERQDGGLGAPPVSLARAAGGEGVPHGGGDGGEEAVPECGGEDVERRGARFAQRPRAPAAAAGAAAASAVIVVVVRGGRGGGRGPGAAGSGGKGCDVAVARRGGRAAIGCSRRFRRFRGLDFFIAVRIHHVG